MRIYECMKTDGKSAVGFLSDKNIFGRKKQGFLIKMHNIVLTYYCQRYIIILYDYKGIVMPICVISKEILT